MAMFTIAEGCVKVFWWLFLVVQKIKVTNSISDAYQESALHPYRTYNDVAIFHYFVPNQVTRATWEFAAFMDSSKCTEREVHISLQPGSYPVINPDNSSFPKGTYIDQLQQFTLTTVTKHQPHDAVVFHAFNPVPGNWFAVAYIMDWVHEIRQQGLSHKCRYSLGSMASWVQTNDVNLIIPSVPFIYSTSLEYAYFKFFIPENIWSFQLVVSNFSCHHSSGNHHSCIHGVGVQARALPFPTLVNMTDENTYVFSELQPEQQAYYYVIVTTASASSYTVIVQIEECLNLLNPNHSINLENISPSLATSRHSNQSVSEDWEAIVLGVVDNHTAISDDFHFASKGCLPTIPLARIKHAQDFTDTFLIQGKDWYTSWLVINNLSPLIVKFELLPFVDIGGTLKFGLQLFDSSLISSSQIVLVMVCINRASPPKLINNRIQCKPQLNMNVSSEMPVFQENTLYFPFPQPGMWFASFEIFCLNRTFEGTIEPSPCIMKQTTVYLDVRVQPCMFEGKRCGTYGECEENHRGQFFFSSCRCFAGWRGWGCTDGSNAVSSNVLLMKTLILTLSNLFFIPAVAMAVKRKFYTEAVVYTFTMLFSILYHACDEDAFAFCLMKFDVLQFCDFYSAILSFWVTLVAMASLPWKINSILHMGGALSIALGVEYQRTGLWVFVAPLSIGVVILIISWIYHCRHTKSCYPVRQRWLTNFLPGVLLVATGLILFAFIETESNYKYIHSAWHVIIALSIVFLLPLNATNSEEAQPVLLTDDSEIIDVNDYSLSTDFERLVNAKS